jgi:hypothetical protein
MGDRANIYLTNSRYRKANDTKHGIYLYTHWSGYSWPDRLRRALEFGRNRWDDPQYLQKIIMDQVFKKERDEETGAGVSLDIGDNQYPIIVVDVNGKTVSFADEGHETDRAAWYTTMTFAEYVAQSRANYPPEE